MKSSLQSNQVIEENYRKNQQKYAIANNGIKNQDPDITNILESLDTRSSHKIIIPKESNSINTTKSSEMRSSCNILVPNLCKKINSDELNNSEKKLEDINIARYKNNASISKLLKNHLNYSINTDNSTNDLSDESEVFYNNKNISTETIIDKAVMHTDNLNKLFESEEVSDVFYHPLMEQIQKDSEWQNLRLKRKGNEFIESSRQYYMNMDNSSFKFEPSKNQW
jgi:hypothetical protein